MGILDEIQQRYGTDLNQAIGYGEDIQRFGTFKEANQFLEGVKQKREQVEKFGNIMNKLNYIDWNNVPVQKQVEEVGINEQHPDFINPENSQNPAIKGWYEYKKKFEETDDQGNKKVQGTPLGFMEYLSYYPELQGQIPEQYFTKSAKNVDMTPDEYKLAALKSAGLSDEEIAFYEQNKQTIDSVDNYNKQVKSYLNGIIPTIKSRFGTMGDIYGQQLESTANDMLIPQSTPIKNQWKIEYKDGKIIKVNNSTGTYSVTDIEGTKKSDPKNWGVFIDEDGSVTGKKGEPFWGERTQGKDGQYKIEYRDVLNKQERDDWQADNDKRDKTGVYTPKTNTGRRTRTGSKKKFSVSNMDASEMKKIKPSDIGTKYKTIEELEELEKNGEWLTEETRDAIAAYKDQGEVKEIETKNDNMGKDSYAYNIKEDIYKGADDEEKVALQSVQSWFDNTIKAWGRNDLTADQWREEISQEQWTDLEFEIIKDLFKQATGENY